MIPLTDMDCSVGCKLEANNLVQPKSALDNITKISFLYDFDDNVSNTGWICDADWKELESIYIGEL